jgi:hypothetical protein
VDRERPAKGRDSLGNALDQRSAVSQRPVHIQQQNVELQPRYPRNIERERHPHDPSSGILDPLCGKPGSGHLRGSG